MDDGEWVTLPGEYTRVWTTQHCWLCNRRVRGEYVKPSWIGRHYAYAP